MIKLSRAEKNHSLLDIISPESNGTLIILVQVIFMNVIINATTFDPNIHVIEFIPVSRFVG